MANTHAQKPFELAAVILGAGSSSRMGRPKLLLPWHGTSVIGHLIGQWTRSGARQIGVVCAAFDDAMRAELNRLEFPAANRIDNPTPERGMFGSIRCAAGWPHWQGTLTHWAIVLGDQPHLRFERLADLIGFARAHPSRVCQPVRRGHVGHPVLLPKVLFTGLASSSARDFKEFLSGHPRSVCEIEDPGLELDIDTQEDYQRALELDQGPRRE